MSDPISNMLTSIRNAQAVRHQVVDVPFSNIKYEIAKILQKQNFIEKVEKKGKKTKKNIEITLKYDNKIPAEGEARQGRSAISGLKRISKQGQRIYASNQKIRKVKGGYGIAIISTSKGIMTDKEARKNKLGGEILCEIW